MKTHPHNFARETRFAKSLYGDLPKPLLRALRELIQRHDILVTSGDVDSDLLALFVRKLTPVLGSISQDAETQSHRFGDAHSTE